MLALLFNSLPGEAKSQDKTSNLHNEAKPSSLSFSVTKDLQYVAGSPLPAHTLDLYTPNTAHKAPLIIYIHGGGWLTGDKADVAAVSPWWFLAKGFAVASINYRFTSTAPFPAQIQDAREAVRWLRHNASEYNLDPEKFVAFGESSGAHLALLLATLSNKQSSSATKKDSCAVSGAIDFSGPANLVSMPRQFKFDKQRRMYLAGGIVYMLIKGDLEEHLEMAQAASPISHVTAKTPPILIVHGEEDDTIPVQQSIELAKRLRETGVTYTLHVRPGMGHLLRDKQDISCAVEFAQEVTSTKASN